MTCSFLLKFVVILIASLLLMQGAQNESLPYVYYTPTYGYAQSPYNPYNPYIPGAMIGVDGPFVGAQQYFSVSPYQNAVSSPAFIPVVLQPDMIPNSSSDSLIDTGASTNRAEGRGSKHNFNSTSGAFSNPMKPTSHTKNSLTMISEGSKSNVGTSKQASMNGSISTGGFPSSASSHVFQVRFFWVRTSYFFHREGFLQTCGIEY